MKAEINNPSSDRIAYLDMLRILCSFLVIVNHTYNYIGLDRVSGTVRFASFWTLFASKAAVPVFLMISGCTLLTKTDSIFKTLKRFVRIAAVLVVFSFFHEAYSYACGNIETLSIKRFLHSIYTVQITTAYWYLYAYAGLLLAVPFLQRMVKNMPRNLFFFFFAISFFFIGLWPIIVEYTPVSEYCQQFSLPLFDSFICYMLLGYFLFTSSEDKKIPTPLLFILFVLCVTLCAAVTHHAYNATGGGRYLFLDDLSRLPITILSVCLFCLVSRIRLSERAAEAARRIGGCSFGIYLFGDLAIAVLFPAFYFFLDRFHPLLAVTIYQILCWLLALAASVLCKHIPLMRKLL